MAVNTVKYLLLICTTSIALTSCTKHFVTADMVTVDVEKLSASTDEHMLIAIFAEYVPKTWGENIEPFDLDVMVTATPATDLSNEDAWLQSLSLTPLHHTFTIASDQFAPCHTVMSHALGYTYVPLIPKAEQHLYSLSCEFQIRSK